MERHGRSPGQAEHAVAVRELVGEAHGPELGAVHRERLCGSALGIPFHRASGSRRPLARLLQGRHRLVVVVDPVRQAAIQHASGADLKLLDEAPARVAHAGGLLAHGILQSLELTVHLADRLELVEVAAGRGIGAERHRRERLGGEVRVGQRGVEIVLPLLFLCLVLGHALLPVHPDDLLVGPGAGVGGALQPVLQLLGDLNGDCDASHGLGDGAGVAHDGVCPVLVAGHVVVRDRMGGQEAGGPHVFALAHVGPPGLAEVVHVGPCQGNDDGLSEESLRLGRGGGQLGAAQEIHLAR
eukprot:9503936-Pyramimonas_sp.AAC.1